MEISSAVIFLSFVSIGGDIEITKVTFFGSQLSDLRNSRLPEIVMGITGTSFLMAVKKAPFLNFNNPSSLRNVASEKK